VKDLKNLKTVVSTSCGHFNLNFFPSKLDLKFDTYFSLQKYAAAATKVVGFKLRLFIKVENDETNSEREKQNLF
jgi:hypothetical protein